MPRYLRGVTGASSCTSPRARRGAPSAALAKPSRPISSSARAGSAGRPAAERSTTSSPSTMPSAGAPPGVENRQSRIGGGLCQIGRSVVQLADQLDHAALDLVAGGADLLERAVLGVRRAPSRGSACRGCRGTRRRSPSSPRRRPTRRRPWPACGECARRGRCRARPSPRPPRGGRGARRGPGRARLVAPAAARANSASLICERPALCRQTKRTRAISPAHRGRSSARVGELAAPRTSW